MENNIEKDNIDWNYIYSSIVKHIEVIKYKLKKAEDKQKLYINFNTIYQLNLPNIFDIKIIEQFKSIQSELTTIIMNMNESKLGFLMIDCKDQLEMLLSDINYFCYYLEEM